MLKLERTSLSHGTTALHQPQLIVASSNQSRTKAIAQTVSLVLPNSALPHQVKPVHYRNRQESIQALSTELNLDVVALIDLTALSLGENPWNVDSARELGLAAELMLSFPEVYFIFLSNGQKAWRQFEEFIAKTPVAEPAAAVQNEADDYLGREGDPPNNNSQLNDIRDYHFISVERLLPELLIRVARHHDGFRTLFDPTKLRNVLKRRIASGKLDVARAHIHDFENRITKAASSIDEESSFLYLNAYVAYKAGFSTWLCSTAAETKRVHNLDEGGNRNGPCKLDLVITDFQLQFSDLRETEAWEGPEETTLIRRIEKLGQANAELNIYVVTADSETTRTVFNDQTRHTILDKPYEGIFHLLHPANEAELASRVLATEFKRLRGLRANANQAAARNEQNPGDGNDATNSRSPDRHSVPFAIGVVADRLLRRARTMLRMEIPSVEHSVHTALLCLETKELLSGLARTMYYEAVCQQQEAEVSAEATFFGIAANLHVDNRIKDLGKDLKLARNLGARSNAANETQAEMAELNCTLQTANNLRIRLHQHEQFEAADECLRAISETESKMARLKLGVPSRNSQKESVCMRIGIWFQKSSEKLATRPPMQQWYERSAGVREKLAACGKRVFTQANFRRIREKVRREWPIVRVIVAAFVGVCDVVRVFLTRGKEKYALWKRVCYLATKYFNYVTDFGTRISKLLEVNLTLIVLFWVIYFVLAGVWSPENEPLTLLQRTGASGLNSVMLFVGGFAGIDDYIGGQPPMSFRYFAYLAVCAFEVTIAYLHLGLLVALLYRKITRSM